jgi:sodium-dependent dicarboxylate transporter 2/3/5
MASSCSSRVGLFLFIYFLPRPESLPVEGHRLGAILVPIVFLRVSEAIPIGITALLATALMIIFKVTKSSAAWAPYANHTVMFVMMIIMFGVILNEVGPGKRLLFSSSSSSPGQGEAAELLTAVSSTCSSTAFPWRGPSHIIMLFATLPPFQSNGHHSEEEQQPQQFLSSSYRLRRHTECGLRHHAPGAVAPWPWTSPRSTSWIPPAWP